MDLLLEGQESARLEFRKLKPSDFEDWLPFYHNPLSTLYWDGLAQDPETACREYFDKIFYRYDHKLGGMNALIHKISKEFIGQCGLLVQEVDGIKEVEIGYSILPKYWRQAYATEAAKKCMDFAFAKRLADSLISIIHVDNIPSQKVALTNGMRLEKTTRYKNNPVLIFRVKR